MKQKQAIPAFKSEAEEAEWWYKNRARLDKHLIEAAIKGTLKRLDQTTLKARLAASRSRVISRRLPEDDIGLARQQVLDKGLPYQTYIKSVLHPIARRRLGTHGGSAPERSALAGIAGCRAEERLWPRRLLGWPGDTTLEEFSKHL